jgi:hypothetical protein
MAMLPYREPVDLLGRPATDPDVESLLFHYGIGDKPTVKVDVEDPDGPVVGPQSWVKNAAEGIEFGFDDEAAWRGLSELRLGGYPMILTQVYFYGDRPGVRPYLGPLPFGLQLTDDRREVREKLSPFESTRHSYVRDTWDTADYRLTVAYAAEGGAIEFVLCALREPPLPSLSYDLSSVPVVEALIDSLGRPLDDPVLTDTFGGLGFADQRDQALESAEVDFLNPYGISLGFSTPLDRTGRRFRQLILSRILLCSERELDARGWKGDLPFDLSFNNSMETAVRKMGRPPDQADDDEPFSAYALWHESNATVHVFYNTMENRIARVMLIAPGFWAKWHED